MIEETFVQIASYNSEMGDWLLNRLSESEGIDKYADLCRRLIICD